MSDHFHVMGDEPESVAPIIGERAIWASVEGADLAKALKAVGCVVEKHNTMPILCNVLLQSDGATLKVTGTDLDMAITYSMPANGEAFAATVNAGLIASLVNRRKDGEFGITATMRTVDGALDTATAFSLKSGESAAKMNVRPVGDFPAINTDHDYPFAATVPVDKLCAAFKRVEFAISTEETRYYLNGAFLHAVEQHGSSIIRLVTTDEQRLARTDIVEFTTDRGTLPKRMDAMPGAIIPRKVVNTILAIFGHPRKGDNFPAATVEISETKIRITSGPVVITSKLVDGTYPNYQRVIPCNNDKVMHVDKGALLDALAFVTSLSSKRGKVIKCELATDVLTIGVTNPDAGETRETVPCRYSGDPMTVGFNGTYLADILAVHTGEMTARFGDPGSPVILESTNGPLCILVPMRV